MNMDNYQLIEIVDEGNPYASNSYYTKDIYYNLTYKEALYLQEVYEHNHSGRSFSILTQLVNIPSQGHVDECLMKHMIREEVPYDNFFRELECRQHQIKRMMQRMVNGQEDYSQIFVNQDVIYRLFQVSS